MKTLVFKYGTLLFVASILLASCGMNSGESVNANLDPKISDDYSQYTNITDYKKWGSYNVHDPSCIKENGYYYIYSTDAILWTEKSITKSDSIKVGNIQIRRSKDLVNWEFVGWAFDSIPSEAVSHIKEVSDGQIPHGIWAPYILKIGNTFRLYYSVSVFGANTSYIGMATSNNPLGPWEQKGFVVKTSKSDAMNAIDPTIVTNVSNGDQWMIYGSFFGGIYCVQLDPQTGLTLKKDDKGNCVARRADGDKKVIEAPEVIYNPQFKKYYMFVSYDALFTFYNVRVGRSDKPEGPYLDMFGSDMSAQTDNYPVLTYAYRFQNHPGWAGTGHCSVINDNGKFFMLHQGRLAPDNLQMVLHVRNIYWNSDGWPSVSPERYVDVPQTTINENEIVGKWENIQLSEITANVNLWQGQIPPGGWKYDTLQFNNYNIIQFEKDGKILDQPGIEWELKNDKLILKQLTNNISSELALSFQWDWERKCKTLVYTGITNKGFAIWGKKIIE